MSVSRRTSRRRQNGPQARRPRVAGTRNRPGADDGQRSVPPAGGTTNSSDTGTVAESERTVSETEAVHDDADSTAAAVQEDAAEDTTAPVSAAEDDTLAETGAVTEEPGTGTGQRDEAPELSPESTRQGPDAAAHREAVTAAAESSAEEGSGRKSETSRQNRAGAVSGSKPVVLTTVLLVLALGFGGLAYWFHTAAHALRYEGPAANSALVDEAKTSEVKGQIGSAVEKLFSYDYANVGKTEKAADELLVGRAVKQYDSMFKTVRKQAPKQQMVLTSTVTRSGVTLLEGNRAEVLLFVNQDATSTGNGKGGVYPAQLTVQAEKRAGKWKITSMSQFSQ